MATYQAAPGKLVQAFVPPKPAEQAAPKAAERPTIAPRPIAASAPPIRESPAMPAPQAATTIDLTTAPKRLPPAPHSNGAYGPLAQSEPSLSTQRRAPPAVPPAQSKPCTLAQAAAAPARKMPNKPLPPPVASSQSSPSAVTATPSPGHGHRPSPFPQQAAKPLPPVEVSKEKEAASERQNSFEGINTTISFVLLSQVIFTSEVDRFFLCTIEVKWGNAQWTIKRPYGQFQAFDAWTNHYVKTINQLPYPLPPAKKFVKPKEKNADKRAAEMKKYIAGISSFVHLFLAHKVGRAMILRFFAPIQAGDVKDPSVPMPFDVPPSLPQGKLLGW